MSGDEIKTQEIVFAEEAGWADGLAGSPDPNAEEVLTGEVRDAYWKGYSEAQEKVNPLPELESVD